MYYYKVSGGDAANGYSPRSEIGKLIYLLKSYFVYLGRTNTKINGVTLCFRSLKISFGIKP